MEGFFSKNNIPPSLLHLKRSYEKNHFLKILKSKAQNFQGIPKIIHQIWIGPHKIPDKCLPFMQSWIKYHPDWEYKLWTNKDLESFSPITERAITNARNIGSKVDIFKYEILYKFGGIYVDADFECIKPFDIIAENSHFFAGIYSQNMIGNGIIGSTKNHPLLKQILNFIKDRQRLAFKNPLTQTGPKLFSIHTQIYLHKNPESLIAIYPVSFFHPYPIVDRHKYWKKNYSIESLRSFYEKPETFVIHYWANSWK